MIAYKDDCILKKIDRLKQNKTLRVLDLFSGCGGLSLGFHKTGYEIVANVELDEEAALSHAINFHANCKNVSQFSKARDIQKTTPSNLFKELGYNEQPEELIDVIVGGPPCQAFTRIGRAKLRETFKDSKAFLKDQRSQLYKAYLEYVKALKPLVVLMENVPDMLNYGGINIADLACNDLSFFGYDCKYTILNTAHFGIPQMR
ncbi:MAG TPA: DNA (cytosine-5-)-methyltransferase, partial [Mucilaginibacter sp.]|nr:DNA (cytosine-5-)-methyltransferase [Mucilaginibacter sp.]